MKNNDHRYNMLRSILILLHYIVSCSCFTLHNRETIETLKSNSIRKHHPRQVESKKFFLFKLYNDERNLNIVPRTIRKTTLATNNNNNSKRIPFKSWDYMFSLLLEFQEREGNCNVPQSYTTRDGTSLKTWLMYQRKNRRKGKLNEEQEQKLNEIGIIWDRKGSWEFMYSLLSELQQREGNCNVPKNYTTPEGKNLGLWLMTQRIYRRKGKLSKERELKLDKLGIIWDRTENWEHMYLLLTEIQQREGDCNIPQNYVTPDDGKKLGMWLNNQRVNRRKGKLYKKREKKLNEVGIVWDPINEDWKDMLSPLLEFQQCEGHCNVPQNYITPDGKKLGIWLTVQRSNRRKGKLNQVQEQKLDDIGIIWDLTESWESMYSILFQFRQRGWNCNVPQNYTTHDGKKLGIWLNTQRVNRRRSKLKEDREKKLDKIGIKWDPAVRTDSWDCMYSLLWEFQQREGNCNVPQKYITEGGKKLGIWLMSQRNKRRKSKLSKEREQKLDEVGIKWVLRKKQIIIRDRNKMLG